MSLSKIFGFKKQGIFAGILIFLLVFAGPAIGDRCIKIASYNLENLFDLEHDGTEYPGYIPGGRLGWNNEMMERKLGNLSRVIHDLSADIIGLQEVESGKALERLRLRLKSRGTNYPHAVIADSRPATVNCALLSRFPVTNTEEIYAARGSGRSILRADLDVDGDRLVVFVNHWKSKSGPESLRLACARALARAVKTLPESADYVLLGDFNSNYNEHETMAGRGSLNDTNGITGLNHILKTFSAGRLVSEKQLIRSSDKHLHYNLWLELPEDRRWSTLFFGRPQSPDAILLPASLYDDYGISYLDNSFDRFDPGYLFEKEKVMRWQRTDKGRGGHLGFGYSDHLPVYACLSTKAFSFGSGALPSPGRPEKASIADFYDSKSGEVNFKLKDCAVIYRHEDNAVIKQADGRAIYVYKAAAGLEEGGMYDLKVTRLKRFYGNLEVTGIDDLIPVGRVDFRGKWYINDPEIDLCSPGLENEVTGKYRGRYAGGQFHYGNQRRIRLYFRDKSLEPESPGRIRINRARIGYHRGPELVIEKPSQITGIDP